jgi:hypothetical protein
MTERVARHEAHDPVPAKGTLVGFAVIYIAELRLVIGDVALHQKGASRWAQLPAKPVVRDGKHAVDETTMKPAYTPLLAFESRAFSAAVWSAVVDTAEAAA